MLKAYLGFDVWKKKPFMKGLIDLSVRGEPQGYPDVFNDAWREQHTNTTISRMLQRLVVDNWTRDKAFAETLDVLGKIYGEVRRVGERGMAIRHRSVAVALPTPARPARWPSVRTRESLGGMVLLAPTLLLLLGLVLYPFFYAIWLAFSDKTVGSPGAVRRACANFRLRLAWPQFSAAVHEHDRLHRVRGGHQVRARDGGGPRAQPADPRAELLPRLPAPALGHAGVRRLSRVALALRPPGGLINYALLDLGSIASPIAFLSDRSTAMGSVIVAHAWRNFPFYAISFLAGMQTISQELYDSAQVDGASRAQQFRFITLPGLYHIIGVVLLLTTIQTANAFEPIYLLTGGGPSDATMVYTMLVYVMGIMNLRLGEAAAVSTLFLPLLVGLVLVVTMLLQKKANA